MRNGTKYLNNTGSKFINYKDGQKEKIYAYINGELIERTPAYCGTWGNHGYARISYKGKMHEIINFTTVKSEVNPDLHSNEIKKDFVFNP